MKQDKGMASTTTTPSIKGSLTASHFFTIVIALLAVVVIIVHFTRPEEKYFADPPSGSNFALFPLSSPNVTPSSLIKWATQAATNAYTIDFYHYKDNIEAVRDYFTIEGYAGYKRALDESDSLKKIIKEKLIVSAVATDTAVIMEEGTVNDIYTWKIQVPLLLNYQGASTTSTSKSIAVGLLVTRVPTDQAPKGIGIAQIVDGEMHDKN